VLSPILVVPDKFKPTPVVKPSTTAISRAIEHCHPSKCSPPLRQLDRRCSAKLVLRHRPLCVGHLHAATTKLHVGALWSPSFGATGPCLCVVSSIRLADERRHFPQASERLHRQPLSHHPCQSSTASMSTAVKLSLGEARSSSC
jgi:hypothetical protein